MSNYHVLFDKSTKQRKGKKEGASKASVVGDTKAEVEKATKELCKNSGGGEVRIHDKESSRIKDSDTIAPGRDPFPPRDNKH